MRTEKKCYLVEFGVYHYNSGAADNHTSTHKFECSDYEEALKIKQMIDEVFDLGFECPEDNESYIWVQDYIYEHTAIGGYITSEASIYKYELIEVKNKIV